jgi:hypothetical protein
MSNETLCVVGGDTTVDFQEWHREPNIFPYIVVPSESRTVKAVCTKPEQCPFKRQCTGKVKVITEENNGLNRNIIQTIYFDTPNIGA